MYHRTFLLSFEHEDFYDLASSRLAPFSSKDTPRWLTLDRNASEAPNHLVTS